jgi:transcriptional regulator with XRE-family HTH domain
MKDRIIEIRKVLKLKQGEFAKELGIKQAALSNIETGRNGVTDANIRLICKTFNINEVWLKEGVGEMFVQSLEPQSYETQELLRLFSQLPPDIRKMILDNARILVKREEVQSNQASAEPDPAAERGTGTEG